MSSGPNPATPEGYNAQVLSELREQTRMLKSIDEKCAVLVQHLGAGVKSNGSGAKSEAKSSDGVAPADDRELDSQYGNPTIKKDPPAKYWDGDSFAGMQYSECPANYLLAFAKWQEAQAFMKRKNSPDDADQQKYARYAEKDAARAKGWAIRNKDMAQQVKPAGAEIDAGGYDDDSIPF